MSIRPSSIAHIRTLLLLDAVTSAAMALLLIALAGPLSAVLGLPAGLLRGAGVLLVPFAAMLALIVQSGARSRAAVGTVVSCNVVWVAASVALLVSGRLEPTGAGAAFVVAQALAVAAFALLQAAALRRQVPAPAR